MNLVNTLDVTFLVLSSKKLIRMFVLIISRSSLIMGQFGSKSGSLDKILGKSCLRSRGHIFCTFFLKVGQNVFLDNISVNFDLGLGTVRM